MRVCVRSDGETSLQHMVMSADLNILAACSRTRNGGWHSCLGVVSVKASREIKTEASSGAGQEKHVAALCRPGRWSGATTGNAHKKLAEYATQPQPSSAPRRTIADVDPGTTEQAAGIAAG